MVEQLIEVMLRGLAFEKVCSHVLNDFKHNVLELFKYLDIYKDKYTLDCYDFREFLADFWYHLDKKNDWEENRYALIIEELAIYYTNEPLFWNTPFDLYLTKLNVLLSWVDK